MSREKHHFIQKAYLKQWSKNSKVQVYIFGDDKFEEKGPNERLFWEYNYNFIDGDRIAEDVSGLIENEYISRLDRIIKTLSMQSELNSEDRSVVAQYVALQYLRTPKYRKEQDIFIDAVVKKFHSEYLEKNGLNFTVKEALDELKGTKHEAEGLEKYGLISDEDFQKEMLGFFKDKENYQVNLNNSGHAKGILRASEIGEKLFIKNFVFLLSPKDTDFITSDFPCFILSDTDFMNGILSPHVEVIFPLTPKICLKINSKKRFGESSGLISKKQVKSINMEIIKNSHKFVISKEKKHLEYLLKNYNKKEHDSVREFQVLEKGDYTMFNMK
jgi:hypothetical protein